MIKKNGSNQPPLARIARVAALWAVLALLGSVPAWAAKQPGMGILYPSGVLEHADGTTVSTSGSTTAGIQELINYCNSNYYDAYIVGGDMSTGGAVVYNCTSSITFPAYQGFRLDTGSVTINFNTSMGANNGLIFDSCMMADIRIRGQIVYPATGYALVFDPRDKFPQDPSGPCITDSTFQFTNVCAGPGSCVLFEGSINNSSFYFNAISNGVYGITMSGTSLTQNKITCRDVSGQTNTQVYVTGVSANNEWDVSTVANGQSAIGIDTAGSNDIWVGGVANSGKAALVLEAGASGNQFHMMQLAGGITNRSTNPTNTICVDPRGGAAQTDLGYACGTPPVPASGSFVLNSNPYTIEVMILTPGTVSSWSRKDVFGAAQAFATSVHAAQMFLVTPGEAVGFTYTAAPTWRWRAVH